MGGDRGGVVRCGSTAWLTAVLSAASLGFSAGAASASERVSVFPSPGSRLATPRTQVSIRRVSPRRIGPIVVTGSRSGLHRGQLRPDSDGRGASFYPSRRFVPGEVVTVRTALPIVGGHLGRFDFTIERPEPRIPTGLPGVAPRMPGDIDAFRSRPDLHPDAVQITRAYSRASDVFVTPMRGPLQWGPMILDRWGHVVWFHPLPYPMLSSNFTKQRYRGRRVLTWWQGFIVYGFGAGHDVIYDDHYRRVATVRAGNGLSADLHEFSLTPQGTALITSFSLVHWDGSSIGASRDLKVLDCTVQEIDIRTGNVLFQWDSLDHIPLKDSYMTGANDYLPFDYFHINSIQQNSDGNLIVSARNTWAVYKIDRTTGQLIWTLGGKHSSFKMGAGTQTAYQHNALLHRGGLMTIFDDGAGPQAHPQSRVVVERLNSRRRRVTLVRALDHSPGLVSDAEGSAQLLANGGVFAGWGYQPYFTQFDRHGRQVFDGHFVSAISSYRAYEFSWKAQPDTAPALAVARDNRGVSTAFASWNGATDVSSWRVLAGKTPRSLKPVAVARRHGFETAVQVRTGQPYFAVQALGSSGHVLARSPVRRSTR